MRMQASLIRKEVFEVDVVAEEYFDDQLFSLSISSDFAVSSNLMESLRQSASKLSRFACHSFHFIF